MSKASLISARMLLDFWQKSYAYQLLILPNHYFTKHISLICLQIGNEKSPPGKQSENNLLWVENSKPKLLDYLLSQQIAIVTTL